MAHAHTSTFVQHRREGWSAVSAFHSSSGRLSRSPIVENGTIRLGLQVITQYQGLEATRRQHIQHSSCTSLSQWNSPTALLPEEVWLQAQYRAQGFHIRYRTRSCFSCTGLPRHVGEFNRATGTRSSLPFQSWLSESIASRTTWCKFTRNWRPRESFYLTSATLFFARYRSRPYTLPRAASVDLQTEWRRGGKIGMRTTEIAPAIGRGEVARKGNSSISNTAKFSCKQNIGRTEV